MATADPWAAFPLANVPQSSPPNADPWAAFPVVPAAPSAADTRPHGGATGSYDDPPVSTAADVAGGFGSGLVKGAAAVPGMVGDLAGAGEYGTSWLVAKLADKLGLLPPGKTADDFLADVKKMDLPAPSGPLGSIENAASLPTTSKVLGAIEAAAGQPLPQPRTEAGRAVENVTSFLPQAALGPGSLARKAIAYGIVPGVASEAAGRAAGVVDPDAEGAARIAGGLLGGGLGHLASGQLPAQALVSGATRGVTDADIAAATALQRQAAEQGISITPAEAIQHVTGNASGLGDLQRNLEGMGESGPVLGAYFRQRPGQVQTAASNLFDRIAPAPTDPSGTAVAAQREAERAMTQVRQERSDATAPYYAEAANDAVPADRMAAVAQRIDALMAQHPNNPALTAPLADLRRQIVETPGSPGQPAVLGQRVPVINPRTGAVIRYEQQPGTPAVPPRPETYLTGVPQLDEIYGGLRDQYTGPAPLGQSGTDARAGRIAAQGLGELDAALRDASPSLAAGRQAHAIMTDRWVAPREAGPIGQIGKAADLQAQGRALYPDNPNIGSQGETAEAVGRMPNTAGALTRNRLETAFNDATQRLQPGPNQWGGAKFAAQALGNRQQEANVMAGLGALPNGGALQTQAQVLADVLRATGTRQQPGSKTAFNDQFRDDMKAGSPLGEAAALAASPGKIAGVVKDAYARGRIGTNAEILARMLTDPEGMHQLVAARNAIPPDRYRSMIMADLLRRMAMTVPAAEQAREGR